MASHRTLLLSVTMVLLLFLLFNLPTYAQNAKAEVSPPREAILAPPKTFERYKAVNEFCNQRATSEDRSFCMKVLKSNPKSASAQDNPTLLKIAIELAVGDAKKTREFMSTLFKNEATKPPLKPVLEQCIAAYEASIEQLQVIFQDLEDNPPMVCYDAEMANEELNKCQNALTTSNISIASIASRHKIATQYSLLCQEIAKFV